MIVHSQKFGYFGHWLSDVNTLEKKNCDTHLVFIWNTSAKNMYDCTQFYRIRGEGVQGASPSPAQGMFSLLGLDGMIGKVDTYGYL